MEVGQHRVDCFEFETGIDEKVGCAMAFGDRASALADCVLQSSNRGGADSDQTARRADGLVNGGRGGC